MMPQMTKQSQSGDKHTQCTVRGSAEGGKRRVREKRKTKQVDKCQTVAATWPKSEKNVGALQQICKHGPKKQSNQKKKNTFKRIRKQIKKG